MVYFLLVLNYNYFHIGWKGAANPDTPLAVCIPGSASNSGRAIRFRTSSVLFAAVVFISSLFFLVVVKAEKGSFLLCPSNRFPQTGSSGHDSRDKALKLCSLQVQI